MSGYTAADVLALVDAYVVANEQRGEFDLSKHLPSRRPFDTDEQLFWRTFKSMAEGLDRTRLGLQASDLAQFAMALNAISESEQGIGVQVVTLDGSPKLSPAYVVRQLLRRGRPLLDGDRFPELAFLKPIDPELHARTMGALHEAQDALTTHAYRSATVVAVFVLEALVDWWLARGTPVKVSGGLHDKIKSCRQSLFTPPQGGDKRDSDEITHLEGQCLVAASLRNLIHADKQVRCKSDIDAGAAHTAMGAVLGLAKRIGNMV